MSRINKKYSNEFKINIVKKYLEGGRTIQSLADEFNVLSKTQIHCWIRKYKESGEDAFKFETRGNPKIKKEIKEESIFHKIEDEVIFLRIENEYLKKICELLKKSKKEG